MKTILTYHHTRNIFRKDNFLPFVEKYFNDVEYMGTETGKWYPKIKVSNWDEVKYKLPKYAIPVKIEFASVGMLGALALGQLGLAREIRGENHVRFVSKRSSLSYGSPGSKKRREWTS